MLTLNTLIDVEYPINQPITDNLKRKLLEENKNKNYSYYSLLKELLYDDKITVRMLLNNPFNIKLFKV